MVGRTVLRWVVAVVASGMLFAGAPASAQVAGTLAVRVDASAPIEPGAAVSVTVTGAPPGANVYVRQCDEPRAACGAFAAAQADGSGTWTGDVTIRRRVLGLDHGVDCSAAACDIVVWAFDDVAGSASASTPIAVVAAPYPTTRLELDAEAPLPDRARVAVQGFGFAAGTVVTFRQCAWTDAVRCLPGEVGSADVGDDGALSGTVDVARVVAGTDCAAAAGRCHVWAASSQSGDHITAARLVFDGTAPPVTPALTAAPADGLVDGQEVVITVVGLGPARNVTVEQCADDADEVLVCRPLTWGTADESGSFVAPVAVRRRVGTHDCAVDICRVLVRDWTSGDLSATLQFDSTVPPPALPTVTVTPSSGLADWQVVDVSASGLDPSSNVSARLCVAGSYRCRGAAYGDDAGTSVSIPLALPRVFPGGDDCAVVSCEVRVDIHGADVLSVVVPVAFDPAAPLAPPPAIAAVPGAGLWDGQRVEVTGQRLEPGRWVQLRQCAGTPAAPVACVTVGSDEPDGRGVLAANVRVRRVLPLVGGGADCAAVACFLLVPAGTGAGSAVAAPLGFDPHGPLQGPVRRAQLECVAWPTEGWPNGPIPAGVDPAAVAALGERMVGEQGVSSVVVIHGGRVVYETYADGVDADTILRSYSMSKSFTATMVGLLVDDGVLSLDERAPVTEWSAPDDPRRAITLRHLLNMASGLEWNEGYGDGSSDIVQMVLSPDTYAYAVARPFDVAPGTRYHYSTGDSQILAGIIGDAAGVTGATYEALLRDRLLDPLGIAPARPGFDAAGTWRGGFQTDTTTRNFAKLALLYLRGGVWEDEQFVSSEWVDFALSPSPASSGYGGQFWLDGDGSFRMVGLYGQHVHAVPDLDLIVAVNDDPGYRSYEMVELFRGAAPPSCGDAAAAVDDATTVEPGSSVAIDVLANDRGGDAGLAPATLTIAQPPGHGNAVVEGGSVRYTPAAGYTGRDSFSYVVCTADRTSCMRAAVAVEVRPDVAFLHPVLPTTNVRHPGSSVLVPLWSAAGPEAVASTHVVPVDCTTGAAIGERTAVDLDIRPFHAQGVQWAWWPTDAAWRGCADLEVFLTDGTTDAARFAWWPPPG